MSSEHAGGKLEQHHALSQSTAPYQEALQYQLLLRSAEHLGLDWKYRSAKDPTKRRDYTVSLYKMNNMYLILTSTKTDTQPECPVICTPGASLSMLEQHWSLCM